MLVSETSEKGCPSFSSWEEISCSFLSNSSIFMIWVVFTWLFFCECRWTFSILFFKEKYAMLLFLVLIILSIVFKKYPFLFSFLWIILISFWIALKEGGFVEYVVFCKTMFSIESKDLIVKDCCWEKFFWYKNRKKKSVMWGFNFRMFNVFVSKIT